MEITDEELLIKNKKANRKIMIIYKMLSYDLLFFYTIYYLFYVNIKGLTPSQVVFGEAFYPLFKILLQIPCTFLVHKIGKRKSLILANSSIFIYIFIIINLVNVYYLIVANIFCAFGYVIKGMCESTLLYDSLEDTENKREQFSKLEGKSNAYYYFFDAITAVLTGFLFAINPYIPLSLSLLVIAISIFLSFKLKEIKVIENNSSSVSLKSNVKRYFKDLKITSRFIYRSNRLKSLIIYDAFFIALITIIIDLRIGILNDLHVSSKDIGIIFTILGFVAAISSRKALSIHKSHRNRTLSFIGLSLTLSVLFSGLIVLIPSIKSLLYYILLAMYAIQYFSKGVFQTVIKQYLNSFCDSNMRLRIYSFTALTESITTTIFLMLSSFLLSIFSPAKATLIIGIFSTLLILMILKYMLPRLGLKPNEYPAKDITYSDLL